MNKIYMINDEHSVTIYYLSGIHKIFCLFIL